jgi:hypothetical protein
MAILEAGQLTGHLHSRGAFKPVSRRLELDVNTSMHCLIVGRLFVFITLREIAESLASRLDLYLMYPV